MLHSIKYCSGEEKSQQKHIWESHRTYSLGTKVGTGMSSYFLHIFTDTPYSLYVHLSGALLLRTCYKANKYLQNLEWTDKSAATKEGEGS